MTTKFRNGLILGGLAIATTALVVYFGRQYNLIKNACYTIAGGVVHSININSVKITLFFRIANESDLTIEVADMVFNVYVNKMFVTKIIKNEKQMLYSKSDATIQLDFEFNPTDLLRAGLTNIAPILYDKEKLVLTIKGSFSAKSGGIKVRNFPIEESITVKQLLAPSYNEKKCDTFKEKEKNK